jgi:UDP-glucose 4-epimerase
VARANVLALDRGDGEILNIGSGTGTSVNTIFSNLADLTGYRDKTVHGPVKKGEVYKIYLNADRAREILGWTPKIPLREGLASTVEYFRNRARHHR